MTDERVTSPRIARYKPYYYKLVPGKTYLWCSCGRSRNQPFCDGSHKGTGFLPVKYVAKEGDGEVLFCGCKHTSAGPFCDGAHNNLRDTYEQDDPESEANRQKALNAHHRSGRFELNGHCCVVRPASVPVTYAGNVAWRTLVARETGARHQSMYFLDIGPGVTPVISAGDAEAILFVTAGDGEIEISGTQFALSGHIGIYVRKGEAFRIRNPGGGQIVAYLSVCPQTDALSFGVPMPRNFDQTQPVRTVAVDARKQQRMADRTFQLLVDKEVGSHVATQFIGGIPLSMAVPHRHLYEEALLILKGSGMIWTEDLKARVEVGDVVFLPSKQVHSLQCTATDGMQIVGVIYPGGNPDINF